jgi:hypothetical protein
MTLSYTWVKGRTAVLVMKRAGGEGPVMHGESRRTRRERGQIP